MTTAAGGPAILQLPELSGCIAEAVRATADRVAAEFARTGSLVVLIGHDGQDHQSLAPMIAGLGGAGLDREQRQIRAASACKLAALLAMRLHSLGIRALSIDSTRYLRGSVPLPRLLFRVQTLLAGRAIPVVAVTDTVSMAAVRDAVTHLSAPPAGAKPRRVTVSVEPMVGFCAQYGEKLDNAWRNPETVGRPQGGVSAPNPREWPGSEGQGPGETPSASKFEYDAVVNPGGQRRDALRAGGPMRDRQEGKT